MARLRHMHTHTDSTYLQLVNDYLQIADFALAGHGLLLSTLEQLLQQRQSERRVGRGLQGGSSHSPS